MRNINRDQILSICEGFLAIWLLSSLFFYSNAILLFLSLILFILSGFRKEYKDKIKRLLGGSLQNIFSILVALLIWDWLAIFGESLLLNVSTAWVFGFLYLMGNRWLVSTMLVWSIVAIPLGFYGSLLLEKLNIGRDGILHLICINALAIELIDLCVHLIFRYKTTK